MKTNSPVVEENNSVSASKNSTPSVVTADTKKTIYRQLLNALMIVAIGILVNLSIRVDYTLFGVSLGEQSLTETLQLVMLAGSAVCFFSLGRRMSQVKHASYLIAAFFVVLMIREMDVWFDMIAHGSWVYPALLVTFAALYNAYKGGKQSINEMGQILKSRHMNMLIGGVMLLLVFSRLYGMGSFWQSVMSDSYIRDVKNISEETMELLCYCLIALGAAKTRFEMLTEQPK
ncbi:hypothetical protein M1D72_01785 [Vibrio sp. AK197]|uniref:Uncharacterized protein n=1 Tax=Vibrio olivae TaxID=1243002 RepID=A0ABV5HSZ9_9VIBR